MEGWPVTLTKNPMAGAEGWVLRSGVPSIRVFDLVDALCRLEPFAHDAREAPPTLIRESGFR